MTALAEPHKSDPSNRSVRKGDTTDLSAINSVIAAAVDGWPLPQRLKRLALPVLTYDEVDLSDHTLWVAHDNTSVVGCAIHSQTPINTARVNGACLLHGLYVHPAVQHRGVGSTLQRRVARAAASMCAEGLLVRAERVATGYFARCGYRLLPAGARDYPYTYWRPLSGATR